MHITAACCWWVCGCLHRVSTDEFSTVLKNKGNALVKVIYGHVRVPIIGAEIKNRTVLVRFLTSTIGFSLVQIMPIGYWNQRAYYSNETGDKSAGAWNWKRTKIQHQEKRQSAYNPSQCKSSSSVQREQHLHMLLKSETSDLAIN